MQPGAVIREGGGAAPRGCCKTKGTSSAKASFETMSNISCAKCKAELPDDLPRQPPTPCPVCGSIARAHFVDMADGVGMHDGHRVKSKRPSLSSDKKLRFDTYSGVEHSHRYGRLVRVHRTVDKDNDSYSEKVIDMQTGEILHECDEPLSHHINHGSAKARG